MIKAVIFDFDGTLTEPRHDNNTWELLWSSLGYGVGECEKYHRQFSRNEITHDEWCEITEKKFKEASCTTKHLEQTATKAKLVADVKEVLTTLKNI